MEQKIEQHREVADGAFKDIRRMARKRYSSEHKIRIVLAVLRGDP